MAVTDIQRQIFLRSKNINPSIPAQLALAFPLIESREDLRHIPNDLARSAIFTVRNKKQKRRYLKQERLFHYNEHISIVYTGEELRAEDDEIVWLQILNYGKDVDLGKPFEFTINRLVKDLGWYKNTVYYDKARDSISRLKANEVMLENTKAYGVTGALSFIENYTIVNDEKGKPLHYRVWINPNLILLFAGNTFTSHSWETYRNLSPVARRMADYFKSHRHPYPLQLESFRKICDSMDGSMSSWKQTVKKACDELMKEGIFKSIFVSSNDRIECVN